MRPRSIGAGVYLVVYVALMALFGITAIAALINLGPWNPVIAITVAACKALLILLYFMQVRVRRGVLWLVAGGGFTWLGILLVLSMSDFFARGAIGIPGK